jgi:periodic tryptophan protein 1
MSTDGAREANGDGANGMDVDMDDKPVKPKASDPSDMSAFKMDEYDDEEAGGVGE